LNISETTQDRAIVIGFVSDGDIFNDLHGPLTGFQGQGIFEVEYLKSGASYGQSYYSAAIGNHS